MRLSCPVSAPEYVRARWMSCLSLPCTAHHRIHAMSFLLCYFCFCQTWCCHYHAAKRHVFRPCSHAKHAIPARRKCQKQTDGCLPEMNETDCRKARVQVQFSSLHNEGRACVCVQGRCMYRQARCVGERHACKAHAWVMWAQK